jgi:signal transduction histidine kinase
MYNIRMRSKTTSIKKQLVQMQLLLTFLVLLACSSAFMFNDFVIFKKMAERSMKSNAKILAQTLAPILKTGNRADAEKVLLNLRVEPSVVSARVVLPNGNLFATFDLEANTVAVNKDFMQETTQFQGGYIIVSQMIGSGVADEGYIILKANLAVVAQEYSNYLWIVFLVFAACFLFAYGLAQLIQMSISRPIIALSQTANSISKSGNYNLRMQGNETAGAIAETRALANEFNHMLDIIQERDHKIQLHNLELEREVEERSQDLVQASKMSALGVMAGGLAHEINTPLATLTLNADRLDDAIKSGTLDLEFLARVNELNKKITDKIARIVRGLKTFSRDGRRDPMIPKSVHELVQETIALCDQRLSSSGVKLHLPQVPPDLMLECRAVEIEQVLLNLIMNAFDATAGFKDRWIRIECASKSGQLEIAVSDCGEGIPEVTRRKIFEPFFTTKEVGKGTGLGLSISIGIAGEHGGTLIYDHHSPNTRFVLTLPLKSAKSTKAS